MQNIQSTAFLGVIAEGKGLVHYQLFKRSVDGEKFKEFIQTLAGVMEGQKWVLYLDNLQVHKTPAAKEMYRELNIPVIWAPKYQPQLNGIEYYFSQLKKHVKRFRLQDMLEERKRKFDVIIPLAVPMIETKMVDKFIKHVYHEFKIKVIN